MATLDTTFDTIVIGAGIAGSSAAYALAQEQRVLLLEQYELLHTNGSSHGDSRVFRHVYEDTRYIHMAVAADEAWQQLEHDAADKLLYRTGGIDVASDPSVLADIQSALAQAGRPFDMLEPSEVSKRFPAFRVPEGAVTLYQADGGVLAANRCVAAAQRAALTRGATVHASEPVSTIDANADRVVITTSQGRYEAGSVIVTAGAWLSQLAQQLGLDLPLVVEKQQVHYLAVPPREVYDVTRMPTFISRDQNVYGIPMLERPLTIKAAAHNGAPTINLDERTFDMDDTLATNAVRGARSLIPEASTDIKHFETCLYTQTPDAHFILDTHPELNNVVFGGGFSGHGFKFGPILGSILKDLSLEQDSGFDLSLFKVDRFTPVDA